MAERKRRPRTPRPVAVRLFEKVERDPVAGCWLWTGSINKWGYAKLHVDGYVAPAHRVSYELFVGPIPEGLQLDHLCRVRHCVNPEHLEPVTVRENLLRGVGWSATNARKTHCPEGHSLTDENLMSRGPGRRECRTCHNDKRRRKAMLRRAQLA